MRSPVRETAASRLRGAGGGARGAWLAYPLSHYCPNLYLGGIDGGPDRRYSLPIHRTLGALANTFRLQTYPGRICACLPFGGHPRTRIGKNFRTLVPMNSVLESNPLSLPQEAAPEAL